MRKSRYRRENPRRITQDIHYGYPGYPICGMTAETAEKAIQKADDTTKTLHGVQHKMPKITEDKYKLTLADICLPDYFRGHHNPVLSVPVWKDMTKAELIESIVSDYNLVYDYLCEGHDNPWPDMNSETLTKMVDTFIIKEMPFENYDIPTFAECEDTVDDVFIFILCEEND